jgi:hypothetical protein
LNHRADIAGSSGTASTDYEPDLNFKKAKAEADAEQATLI